MIYNLENRLLPARDPDQATDRRYLNEDFTTWLRLVCKDPPVISTDHEYSFGCDCFQRLCGACLCDIANDASLRR